MTHKQACITIISASRTQEPEFWAETALGQSIKRFRTFQTFRPLQEKDLAIRFRPVIQFANRDGLGIVYNKVIDAKTERYLDANEIFLFVHDDVWLDDAQLGEHLIEGLQYFDVIGVAGSTQRIPGQPSWSFRDTDFTPNVDTMSGMIGHGTQPCGRLSYFGPWRQKCELLDGVLLATRASTLRRSGVRFDPLFEFHFYDLDFCRTARCGGLTLGTWPIAITHQGAGNYNDDNWLPSYAKYVNKWGS